MQVVYKLLTNRGLVMRWTSVSLLSAIVFSAGCAASSLAAFAQQSKSNFGQECEKKSLYLGPYQYLKFKEHPIRLKFEACADGTAWSNLFNFQLRVLGKLENIQSIVDATINAAVNTCLKRYFSVKILNAQIKSLAGTADRQLANIYFDADLAQCSFPYASLRLAGTAPLSIHSKTLVLSMGDLRIEPKGAIAATIANRIPSVKKYMSDLANSYIEPYVK